MKVKELIQLFTTDTKYCLIYPDRPHNIWYQSRGNNINTPNNDDEIKQIYYHKQKGIIIYI